MKNKIYILAFILILSGCASPETIVRTVVKPYIEAEIINDQDIIYGLPFTSFQIEVAAKESVYEPGPYAKYAKKFLGLDNMDMESSTSHQIVSIEILSKTELDPNNFYVIEPGDNYNFDFMKLTSLGLIMPVNFQYYTQETNYKNVENLYVDKIYPNVSNTEYFAEIDKPAYRRVWKDSAYVRVPVMQSQYVQMSDEDKAEEAAEFIFKIRKERIDLITYESELVFDGLAVKASLDEMKRLEDEYLSLFLGRKFERTYAKTFYVSPKNENKDKPSVVFRFSDTEGVLEADNLAGRPIYLEYEVQNKLASIKDYLAKTNQDEFDEKGELIIKEEIPKFYYRIPELVNIKLVDGRKMIAYDREYINQFGEIIALPMNFIIKENSILEFYKIQKAVIE